MGVVTGEPVSPARVNPIQRQAQQTGLYTLTTALTDLADATLTITTEFPNAVYIAWWAADFQLTTGATGAPATALCQLNVDGLDISIPAAIWNAANAAAGARSTQGQSHSGTLVNAGDHIFKLRASVTSTAAGVGVYRTNFGHTCLNVLVIP